jgi:hypothetical protein
MRIALHYNFVYHPQTDGHTERVNQCLKNYLRCMAFLAPKKWSSWLPMAEWWYNTSYHTSLKCAPFEALHRYKPPMIYEVKIPRLEATSIDFLLQKQQIIAKLREDNEICRQKRSEREFLVGDMVYLKMQPFRHNAFKHHQKLKLTTKYYGPFRVLQKIGKTSSSSDQLSQTFTTKHSRNGGQIMLFVGQESFQGGRNCQHSYSGGRIKENG